MNRLGIPACTLLTVLGVALLILSCRPSTLQRWFGKRNGTIPESKLPGPPRSEEPTFALSTANAKTMTGQNDPQFERWADLQGNYYSRAFAANFDYEKTPTVRVRIDSEAQTLQGRIEAEGLKPNFCYQLKLVGDFAVDRTAFETIGRVGRWRLPGYDTNYVDEDYHTATEEVKAQTSAYIFFDYLVTDSQGRAVRDFALDSSLHVVWSASRQRKARGEDCITVKVDATDPALYMRPKEEPTEEVIWAEREIRRYTSEADITHLPVGSYKARLELTEESFHSQDRDGGWWATVMTLPIEFAISEGQ
ncbi:MAG: hypothetical protein ACYTGH_17280 [Planctomycetota bacterium]|jgi:hypothetical protein